MGGGAKPKKEHDKTTVWLSPDEYRRFKRVASDSLEGEKLQQNQHLIDVANKDHKEKYFKKSEQVTPASEVKTPVEAVAQPVADNAPPARSASQKKKASYFSQRKSRKRGRDDSPGSSSGHSEDLGSESDTRSAEEEENRVAEAASAFLSDARQRRRAGEFVKKILNKTNHTSFRQGNVYVKKKKIGPLSIILANLFDRKIQIKTAQNMHLLAPMAETRKTVKKKQAQ